MKRLVVLLLLACAGCSAQSDSSKAQTQKQASSVAEGTPVSADVQAKIVRQVQAQYDLPSEVIVEVGPRRPSDFPTYDEVTISLKGQHHEQKVDFLLSQDGKTLAKVTKIDLTKDIYAERMKQIDVAGRPVRGNPNAKVLIVNYDDLQCPFCSRMHNTLMEEILPQYGDRVKIVYKDFPLSMHPWAKHSANDANCLAQSNGKAYWEFADYIHGNQKMIGNGQDIAKSTAELDRIALEIGKKNGMDETKLQACLKNPPADVLKASMAEGEALGMNATPTMYINGQKLEGAVDADDVRAVIDSQLVAAGVQPPARPAASAQPQPTSK